jgi:hypothetical protein
VAPHSRRSRSVEQSDPVRPAPLQLASTEGQLRVALYAPGLRAARESRTLINCIGNLTSVIWRSSVFCQIDIENAAFGPHSISFLRGSLRALWRTGQLEEGQT